MPDVTAQQNELIKRALTAAGRPDLAHKFVIPMSDYRPCWEALKALEFRTDKLSAQARSLISWNMLRLS